jgi:hypothetical protein
LKHRQMCQPNRVTIPRRPRIRSGRSLRALGSPLNARPLGGRRTRKFSCDVADSTSRRVCASRSHLTGRTIHLASRPGSRRLRPLVPNLADG